MTWGEKAVRSVPGLVLVPFLTLFLILAPAVIQAPAKEPVTRPEAAETAAPADPGSILEQSFSRARQGLETRDAALTMESLREAIAMAWRKIPFTALEVHLVAEPPGSLGQYSVRPDNVYRSGEPLYLYLEPVGFTVGQDKESMDYVYDLAVDFNLVDEAGNVMGGRRDIARFRGRARYFPQRLPISVTYDLPGLPAGKYELETVLRDILGKRSHTVRTAIVRQ